MEHYKNLSLNNIEGEVWKDIEGYHGNYLISSLGRIKSITREESYPLRNNDPNSKIRIKKYQDKILKQKFTFDRNKNPTYLLSRLKYRRSELTHRIVAKAFINNPENKPFVNHKDGVKTNNTIDNLEWCTKLENEHHAWNVLKRNSTKGERNRKAILTQRDVEKIRRMYSDGLDIISISKSFNISYNCVYAVAKRHTWKHVH